ncbi:MAG: N-acetylmuramoyl-L-alanine amidase [Pseudomonadota bacterium]
MSETIDAPSPNFDDRQGRPVEYVVLHYTGMKTGADALERLRDPAAKVSAHYMIEEDGRLFRLVPDGKRAWHAGVSYWRGERDMNAVSIGIELVNPGHEFGYRPFPERQIDRLVGLLKDLFARHPRLTPERVIGHSDVAPARKTDPGELFPWDRLAKERLALPTHGGAPEPVEEEGALAALGSIGYLVDDETREAALAAFQRRFRPDALGAGLEARTRTALRDVAARLARR